MRILKFVLMAVPVILFSCNNQQNRNNKNLKDLGKTAELVENAKVEFASPDSVDFIKEAVNGGLLEVDLGRYAEQNAANPRVKNFGAMMVRDHSKANEELKSIASAKSIKIPEVMDDSHMNTLNDVKKMKGSDFDKAYMKVMVGEHEKAVSIFRQESENGNDQELKSFAGKTLPVLLMHQDSAKSINNALEE